MYDSNSPFTIVMNSYMSDGVPVVPISNADNFDVDMDLLVGNTTRTAVTTADVMANLTRTLAPNGKFNGTRLDAK